MPSKKRRDDAPTKADLLYDETKVAAHKAEQASASETATEPVDETPDQGTPTGQAPRLALTSGDTPLLEVYADRVVAHGRDGRIAVEAVVPFTPDNAWVLATPLLARRERAEAWFSGGGVTVERVKDGLDIELIEVAGPRVPMTLSVDQARQVHDAVMAR